MGGQDENKIQLDIIRKRYEDYTGLASDISRKLALAGIAVIWIFKVTEGVDTHIPENLIKPLFFLALSLTIDLLQYLIGALVWWIYYLVKEGQLKNNRWKNGIENAPRILSIMIWIPFWLKVISMVIAYCYLIDYLWKNIV